MTMPPAPFVAGQEVTADELNAQGRGVVAASCSTLASSTAEAIIAQATIPAGDVGLVLNGGYKFIVSCVAAVASATTPTLTLRVRLGSVTGSLVAQLSFTCSSGATNLRAWAETEFLITAAGASGTADFMTEIRNNIAASASTVSSISGSPDVTVDTQAALTICLTAQWGTNSASNTITANTGVLDRV